MGILRPIWSFEGAPPPFEAIAREMERRIGAPVVLSGHESREERHRRFDPEGRLVDGYPGPSEFATLAAPGVCRAYEFELGRLDRALQIEAGIPPHPYLWLHLEAALRALGGTPKAEAAQPALPGAERLDRPWAKLDAWTRFRLGRLPWFMWSW